MILIQKLIYIDFFDHFWSLSINVELFYQIWIRLNRFRRSNLIRFQEFGSKMSIKWQFKFDSRENISLSRFNPLSLVPSVQKRTTKLDHFILFFQNWSKLALELGFLDVYSHNLWAISVRFLDKSGLQTLTVVSGTSEIAKTLKSDFLCFWISVLSDFWHSGFKNFNKYVRKPNIG